jgi:peptidyl-prolyl cis-trans isomerase B (cyclophilin B)
MSKKHPLKSSSLILLAAIAVILITFFIIKPHKESSDKNQDNAKLLYPDLEREAVIEVSIKSPDTQIQLTRSAENAEEWHIDSENQKHRADKNAIDGMVSTILASKKETEVNNVDATNVGLDPAKFSLTLPVGNPATPKTLLLGDDTPVDYLVYAKWEDEPSVFTTSRSLRFAVDKKTSDLRNKKVLSNIKAEALKAITVTTFRKEGLAAQKLDFVVNPETTIWQTSDKTPIVLDNTEVAKWIGGITAASAKTFLSDIEKEKSKFGINSPVATIKTVATDGTEQTWILGVYTENKEKKWAIAEASGVSTYELTPTFVDNFKVDLFKFRDKKIVNFDPKKVQRFTVDNTESPELEFVRSNGKWSIMIEGKAVAAKQAVVETSLRTITEMRADKFHSSTDRTLGFAKPQRLVNIELEQGTDPIMLVFGKSLAPDEIVVKSSQTANPASVAVDLEKTLSVDATAYIDEREKTSKAPKQKGDAIKMESTVADLKDLKKLSEPITKAGYEYTGKMVLQDGKEFGISFDAEKAPYTVSNFLHLARNGFYNNVKFHRVIPDFMAQGGDPTGTGRGGPGWKFHDEQNDLTHQRGVLSMANAGPDTNGSQFFIVFTPQPHLNGKHTVFGKITSGLDQIERIKNDDVIKSLEVFERSK